MVAFRILMIRNNGSSLREIIAYFEGKWSDIFVRLYTREEREI